MKKLISLLTVLVLSVALVVPAFATNDIFVPSITAKPAPSLSVGGTSVKVDGTQPSNGQTSDGQTSDGQTSTATPVVEVKNEKAETVYSAPVVDLVVTAVSQVQKEETAATVVISEEAVETLKEAYTQLNDTSKNVITENTELVTKMKEQLVAQVMEQVTKQLEEKGATAEEITTAVESAKEVAASNIETFAETAVVTALFDVSVMTEELEQYLEVEGNSIDLTFEADIPEGHGVIVMVFKNDKWQTIKNVTVNGDGTITCTFEHFCPVAILTAPIETVQAPVEPSQPAADGGFSWIWVVVAAVIVVAVVAVKGGKKKAAK